ncbi:MAG: hypothetical protein EXR27_16205 [Betaproteobacteria bacterium]|nr:hypothetical protein [Betaproteobacteria bacterium]
MPASAHLNRLIDMAAPFWAAEAEVVGSYFASPKRTRETDLAWLALQCYKEFWGASMDDRNKGLFLGPIEGLLENFKKIDTDLDRHEVQDILEGLWAEFSHYVAFADAYDAMALPGTPKLNPFSLREMLKENGGRKEDDELTALRVSHKDKYGAIGMRALRFTEGGYCTLFSEGMKLKGKPRPGFEKADLAIAKACERVYDDEFGHMLKGVTGLDEENLTEEQWKLMGDLSLMQLRGRILMRNAQFGYPVGPARVEEMRAGKCKPLVFDYERAKLAA